MGLLYFKVALLSSVLIFDSGIGGLSILQHIKAKLPGLDIHYLADHAAFPYGEKNAHWLTERVNRLVGQMDRQLAPSAIIIACNTASTLTLPSLRAHIRTPIIGVVPAIKTAANLSQNNKIGLLATPGTVSRPYMDQLIKDFAPNAYVTRVGNTELVNMAEQKLNGIDPDLTALKKIIQPFIQAQCDHVVLGCTHFPLLLKELEQLNTGITWVDSGEAIANRTQTVLQNKIQATHNPACFHSTRTIELDLQKQLKEFGFQTFQSLTIST